MRVGLLKICILFNSLFQVVILIVLVGLKKMLTKLSRFQNFYCSCLLLRIIKLTLRY